MLAGVGRAMNMLLEHRIDEGPYSEDEALDLLRSWASDEDIEVLGNQGHRGATARISGLQDRLE